jgi:fructan beta-fructosidase
MSVGGVLHRRFQIELADAEPEWWAFIDLLPFQDETITLAIHGENPSAGFEAVYQSDEIVGHETMYREARRPQLRFSSRRGWLNDPNGLVFFDGEYHLFYQHNPYGVSWGNMHWGHAVSPDLVHWEELPIALYPDELGPMFSGSAVVDWANTAGFQRESEDVLVAIYTAAGKPYSQCVAASSDRGRHWTKYPGNPVLRDLAPQSRDPKVFWYAPDEKWVMALYLDDLVDDEHPDLTMEIVLSYWRTNKYGLFASPDLKNWEKLSEVSLPEDGECPELFEMEVEDSPGESRWIFFGVQGRYLIGDFDGKSFTRESGPHCMHQGNAFHAAQTFNELGRRVAIAWGTTIEWDATVPQPVFAGMPFNQSMGVPIELSLRANADGLRLHANPVSELQELRLRTTRITAQPLTSRGDNPLSGLKGDLWDIEAELSVGDAKKVVLDVGDIPIVYDMDSSELICLDTSARLDPVDGRLGLRVIVDRTAIDIFANDGPLYMPLAVDLSANSRSLCLRAESGDASIRHMAVHELGSIWP